MQQAAHWAACSGCRKSGLRHFFEVFIAPLRLRRGQGAMQGNPCYARLFADLPYTPPNPIIASGGQSRAPPVAGGARRKPSEQGSARKAPRADAARPLRTALRPPNPRGFFDKLSKPPNGRLAVFPFRKLRPSGGAAAAFGGRGPSAPGRQTKAGAEGPCFVCAARTRRPPGWLSIRPTQGVADLKLRIIWSPAAGADSASFCAGWRCGTWP